jgi:hypothetical protein
MYKDVWNLSCSRSVDVRMGLVFRLETDWRAMRDIEWARALVDATRPIASCHKLLPYSSTSELGCLLILNKPNTLYLSWLPGHSIAIMSNSSPLPSYSSPAHPATGRRDVPSTPGALAFLVHSQETVANKMPPDVDNKALARQRRRRTR